jgi:hypothetical protein
MTAGTPRASEVLEQTRSAVLNVLIIAGAGIAASGLLLRWRDSWALSRAPESAKNGLIVALALVAVFSHLTRRSARGDEQRFYRGHVLAAALAALAVPLGLAFGWFVRPRLDAVAPFWIVALALGWLALPRAYEVDEFEPVPSHSDETPS